MSGRQRGVAGTVRAILQRAREVKVNFLAAAVAYYGLVSLIPLAALATLAVTVVAGDAFAGYVIRAVGSSLSATGQETLRQLLTEAAGRRQAGLIGGVVLLWGASRLFRGLNQAFGEVYATPDTAGVVSHVRDAVVSLLGVLLAAALVIGAELIPVVDQLAVWLVIPLRFVFLVVLLLPVYYVLPNVPISAGEAFPGALLTALGWSLLYISFDRYVDVAGASALGGVVGGVVLMVTFLYIASFLLLTGAVLNAELAEG